MALSFTLWGVSAQLVSVGLFFSTISQIDLFLPSVFTTLCWGVLLFVSSCPSKLRALTFWLIRWTISVWYIDTIALLLGAFIKSSRSCLNMPAVGYCDPWSGKWRGYWGLKGQAAYTCLMVDMPAKMAPVGGWGELPGNWLRCFVLTG